MLRIINGYKTYGGVHAIDTVSFDSFAGAVHALVGENGTGISTVCKAIAGAIRLTSGQFYVDGKPARFETPRNASAAGGCQTWHAYQATLASPEIRWCELRFSS